jgi:Fic family protein
LFDWHAHVFPSVRISSDKFRVGAWRDDGQGLMQGCVGSNRLPQSSLRCICGCRIEHEMGDFSQWFDGSEQEDPLLKAAIAHLWFLTIHPFEDGNGRMGRAISEMCLSQIRRQCSAFLQYVVTNPRKTKGLLRSS